MSVTFSRQSPISRRIYETYPTVLWDTCRKDLQPLKNAVLRIDAVIANTISKARDIKDID
jgi:hypothetical protein